MPRIEQGLKKERVISMKRRLDNRQNNVLAKEIELNLW